MPERRSVLRDRIDVILEWVREHGTDWVTLAQHMGDVNPGQISTFWKRAVRGTPRGAEALKAFKENSTPAVPNIPKASHHDLPDRIFKYVTKNPSTLLDLCERFDSPPKVVRGALAVLAGRGVEIDLEEDVLAITKEPVASLDRAAITWSGQQLRFMAISDTHLGSKYEALEELHSLYEEADRRGITDVLHSGDLVDGEKMYRGHEYEIHTHGADQQMDYARRYYPRRNNIRTHLIAGNHDWSFYKRSGYDVCKRLVHHRDDIKYYGPIGKTIDLRNRERPELMVRLHLIHPRGRAAAYARSYKLQKLAEAYPGGEKPHIALAGHWHYQCHLFMRNIHLFQMPCLQWQTPFMKELHLQPVVGGYFLEFEFNDDGTIARLQQELVTFYQSELAEELKS